jgi:hypothetical protein
MVRSDDPDTTPTLTKSGEQRGRNGDAVDDSRRARGYFDSLVWTARKFRSEGMRGCSKSPRCLFVVA